MEPLDGLFLGLISSAILFLMFVFIVIILKVLAHRQLGVLTSKKAESKRERRYLSKQRSQLNRRKQRQTGWLVGLTLLLTMSLSGAFYTRYYLSTHLNTLDSESIVKGYYLVEEAQGNLEKIKGDNPKKAQNTLREITARMAGYGVNRSSNRLSLKRQQTLNRYYVSMKELGLNLSSQSLEALQDQETYDSYISDLKKIRTSQEELFKLFNVNEDALKTKK